MDDLIKQLTSPEAMRATLGDIERLLAKAGPALICGLFQAYIDARCAPEQPVEVIGADGVRTPAHAHEHACRGEVSVRRRT